MKGSLRDLGAPTVADRSLFPSQGFDRQPCVRSDGRGRHHELQR